MKTVYGPVASWRLGRSLGVDLICRQPKVCSLNCIYCQLGQAGEKINQKQVFVPTVRVKRDLEEILPKVEAKTDVVTFSGTGEPTLAENLSEVVDFLKGKTNLPLAILTNSTLLSDAQTIKTLNKLDIVIAKLDAGNEDSFRKINNPLTGLSFEKYLMAIKNFRRSFPGKFSLQMMFIEQNRNLAKKMAKMAQMIKPDEVQINTPLRPCKVAPLSELEIKKIKKYFIGFKNVITVYESDKPKVSPLSLKETGKRRPKL